MFVDQLFTTIFILGMLRPAIVFDTVRNYLKYRGYEVNLFLILQMWMIK